MILAAYYHTILGFFFAVFAIVLMLVILLQRGKGVGLAGAFGGAGGGTAFGAKTGDVLTWLTIGMAVAVLIFAVILNYVFRPSGPNLGGPAAQAAPVTTPAAPAAAPVTPPVTPAETPAAPVTTPTDSTATPAETPAEAPAEATETPADPTETPEETTPAEPEGAWHLGDRADWPRYASHMIFGAERA